MVVVTRSLYRQGNQMSPSNNAVNILLYFSLSTSLHPIYIIHLIIPR